MIAVSDEIAEIKREFNRLASPEKANAKARFYKTGQGAYAEHTKFIGLSTPELKIIAKKYKNLPVKDIKLLLQSEVHEEQALALFILVSQYKLGDVHQKQEIYDFYLENLAYVDNWDLVDNSCPYIVGDYLLHRNKDILFKYGKSSNIWERRVAIVSTLGFIRNNEFEPTIRMAENLLNDSHDLIHKACGWMLREIYKRDPEFLIKFLKSHVARMPRTMLRYAIERFPFDERSFYLNIKKLKG